MIKKIKYEMLYIYTYSLALVLAVVVATNRNVQEEASSL